MNMKHFFVVVLCVILPALLFAGDDNQQPAPPLYKILYSFGGNARDGTYPKAGLLRDAAGNLYGTTFYGGVLSGCGGNGGCGTVFKLDKTGKETVLYRFTGLDGANPSAGLIRDADGNLYGTTEYGGTAGYGTVFILNKTGKETVLYSFLGETDGGYPAGLVRDAAGNLYGTTFYGGDINNSDCRGGNGCGVVFKIDTKDKETVLYTFTGGTDGGTPLAGLLRDAAGNLYGTTAGGGIGCGVVFTLDNTNKETVLYSLQVCDPGRLAGGPDAGVIRDAAGNLYSTTVFGGPNSDGDVFKLDPNGNFTELHYFSGTDGANPSGSIIHDSDGAIYGTTDGGGGEDSGVVFQIPRKGTSVLHSFKPSKGDGSYPLGGLIRDAAGNFYGTTQQGGKYNGGTVFKITP
jgi:uncharacterized repeat protein (TIGR03803 family)